MEMFTARACVFLPLVLQTPIQLPAEVRGRPGRLIVIQATAPGIIRWHSCSGPDHLDRWSTPDGKTLIVCTPTPGVYHLLAWTAVDGTPTEGMRCAVIVETEEPPRPPDPFLDSLKQAWTSETATERVKQREQLVGVYRAAADLARQDSLTTLGEFLAAVQKAARIALPAEALPKVRAAIAAELRTQLPTDPATRLDPALRERCRAQFTRIAAALEPLR
jgi:hypothetical protein